MKIDNSKGNIYYGMHFYPGVAEYEDPNTGSFRVFVNENTIRSMDSSFAGRPVFVNHVDGVDENVDEIRGEADGWVIESFYNAADGKHWVKFIVVSERGENAIKNGFRLSNAYVPSSYDRGGVWNGVKFSKEITEAEYEHLAIVDNPRYDESVIMTPDQFKAYNERNLAEVKRIANSNKENKGAPKMKLNIFKRTKVENSMDITGMAVELPKSKKEMLITEVIAKYDAILNMNGYANGDHMVKVGEDEMSVNDLVKKHIEMQNKMVDNDGEGEPGVDIEDEESMDNGEDEDSTIDESMKDLGDHGGDESLDNEEEEEMEPKKKKMNSAQIKAQKIANARKIEANKAKAKALKNARPSEFDEEVATVELGADRVARGKARYGSN